MSVEVSELRWIEDCYSNFSENLLNSNIDMCRACISDMADRGHSVESKKMEEELAEQLEN